MRNVLYRGKTVKGDWIYGSLVITTTGNTKTWIVSTARGNGGWFNVMKRNYVYQHTVGQSTGKEDINRKLVFDGDRLKREGFWPMRVLGIRVVPDDDVQRANCIPSRCKGIDEFDFSEWEVFGNIHDKDPE